MIWGNSDRMNVEGVDLECASWGPSPQEAPTLVLLHEGLGSVASWRDFPQALVAATGCGVFAYSRAGYGQSDPAELPRSLEYMSQEAQDVLPKVLDIVDIRRCVLVGHSDGATIAAIYAGTVIDHRVRGLALMAPHFFTEDMGLAAIAEARRSFEDGTLAKSMQKYHRDPTATFFGWNDAWLHTEFENWDVSDVIDYIRIPTLVMQGAQDQYGTLRQVDEIAQRSYAPVDVLILDDCGHAPHLDQPDQALHAITEFIQRLERIEHVQVSAA